MEKNDSYLHVLKELRGKTIAIVYIYEGEDAPGFQHYWVWKSDIISGWLTAVQELGCLPFILDVRTFVQKAVNRTLPHIDFVLNLNCGSVELSSMGVVPSICSFLSLPCIPCDTCSIVTSENKRISNLIASAMNIPIPAPLQESQENGIYRPLNMGNSIGVEIGYCTGKDKNKGTYQEFIPGYDITLPIVYNPFIDDIDLLPAIIYLPNTMDPNWIYDETEKEQDDNFRILINNKIDDECKKALLNFAKEFPINTFGRIDARIKCLDSKLNEKIVEQPITLQNFYFVEINSMPTIEKEDSFEFAFDFVQTQKNHSLYSCANLYMNNIEKPSINGFLLSCAMISLIKAKY